MMAPRMLGAPPAKVKPAATAVKHVGAPLKGLSLASKLTTGDPQTATVLKNFVVEDDRILSRAGYLLRSTLPGSPVHHLMPYYGDIPRIAAMAGTGTLYDADTAAVLKGGFTQPGGLDWTSFSNLGERKYTVFVTGGDGVWSWDGGTTASSTVPVTNLKKANPAVATVGVANISKFVPGQSVNFTGGVAPGMDKANGLQVVGVVDAALGTFTLIGVDTTAAAADQTTGMNVTAQGSFTKEAVKAPASATYIVTDQLQLVLTHMNRLFFADSTNMAVYYLPLQSKTGELKVLPLNALFKRGGYIKAMYTWTLEGGTGINDQLVIFSSNGEAVIYAGTDPETDFQLVGIFRFDTPMSKHSVVNYGGELYVLIPTGVVPMSTMLRAESEQLGQVDRNVISLFLGESIKSLTRGGWQLFLNPSSGRLFTNMPTGAAGQYRQMVRHMPRPVWSEFEGVNARCWGWIEPYLYFGTDLGKVYRMHPSFLNDDGKPIKVDVQMAWSIFGSPALKQFKMMKPYLITDGDPNLAVEVMLDYKYGEASNVPDVTLGLPGAEWDVTDWAVDNAPDSIGSYWAADPNRAVSFWQGVSGIGRVGAPRLTAQLMNCQLAVAGFDVVFETGFVVG